jgi:meiotic recombination protein SPO11
MRIMLTYKNGSDSLRHESDVITDRLNWIGPKSNDVFSHPPREPCFSALDEAYASNSNPRTPFQSLPFGTSAVRRRNLNPFDSTLPLSITDRKLAVSLLDTLSDSGDRGYEDKNVSTRMDYLRELQTMLFVNTKAEIQAVDDAGDLTGWLNSALVKEICKQ